MDSKALSKIQSVALIAIIVVAAVAGSATYFLWSGPAQPAETIRIGVCADLDNVYGKQVWRGAVLAAEQINAQGGVLGRNLTIIGEDDDSNTPPVDIAVATNALTKLITFDKADYVISPQGQSTLTYQDICAEHKRIYFSLGAINDNDTQRVLDNYDRYKYFFRVYPTNMTSAIDSQSDSLRTLRNYTGFTKVALLAEDFTSQMAEGVKKLLLDYGFDVVYYQTFPPMTADFTSYFAAIEASGAQILSPLVLSPSCYPLVKEYSERQSPFVMWGVIGLAQKSDFWELTDGKM